MDKIQNYLAPSNPQQNQWLAKIPNKMVRPIDMIYTAFDRIYLQTFRAAFTTANEKILWENIWANALLINKVTEAQVTKALNKLPKLPPSMIDFIDLCLGKDGAWHETAFFEAINQLAKRRSSCDKWSHPAIYWAAMDVGEHAIMTCASWPAMKARWTAALDARMNSNCPPIPEQLTVPRIAHMKSNPELGRQYLTSMLNNLRGIRPDDAAR